MKTPEQRAARAAYMKQYRSQKDGKHAAAKAIAIAGGTPLLPNIPPTTSRLTLLERCLAANYDPIGAVIDVAKFHKVESLCWSARMALLERILPKLKSVTVQQLGPNAQAQAEAILRMTDA